MKRPFTSTCVHLFCSFGVFTKRELAWYHLDYNLGAVKSPMKIKLLHDLKAIRMDSRTFEIGWCYVRNCSTHRPSSLKKFKRFLVDKIYTLPSTSLSNKCTQAHIKTNDAKQSQAKPNQKNKHIQYTYTYQVCAYKRFAIQSSTGTVFIRPKPCKCN